MYYKYWLLYQLDLINDVKFYITTFLLIKIIKSPLYHMLTLTNKGCYYKDNLCYKLRDLHLLESFLTNDVRYHGTYIEIENQQIISMTFVYFIHDTLYDYDIDLDLSTINTQYLYLYSYNNLIYLNDLKNLYDEPQYNDVNSFDKDGLYTIDGDCTFVYDIFR